MRKKLRALEAAGIIQTIRRKVVASFTSRVRRVRFDFAVQTSNSYVFNFADARPAGAWRSGAAAAAKPQQSRGSEPDAKFRHETSLEIKTNLTAGPRGGPGRAREAIEAADRTA